MLIPSLATMLPPPPIRNPQGKHNPSACSPFIDEGLTQPWVGHTMVFKGSASLLGQNPYTQFWVTVAGPQVPPALVPFHFNLANFWEGISPRAQTH